MEDVSFFLVGKIEGTIPRAKKVLPTYPCTQPSDTLAFRNALTKYMETLKHAALHPGTANNDSSSPTTSAWWWKDVIIRKSLLEECHGERFMRLILALSTHALLRRPQDLSLYPSEQAVRLALYSHADAMTAYASELASFKTSRETWETAGARLIRRQDDLNHLKRQLEDPTRASQSSKYGYLATNKLLALRDARIEDLLQGSWSTEGGKNSLYSLFEIVGLSTSADSDDVLTAELPTTSNIRIDNHQQIAATPPPDLQSLPLAAALHPKRLRQLCKPVSFTSPSTSSNTDAGDSELRGVAHLMSDRLVAEAEVNKMLSDALKLAQQSSVKLKEKVAIAENSRKHAPQETNDATLKLWTPRKARLHSLRVRVTMTAPGVSTSPRNVQARVDEIRASLKASWPPIRDAQPSSNKIPVSTQLPRPVPR
ncbi:hypothetical protein EIP86_008447 [Pleurotus ostreatoroseus]|nr:hypothetical protein EIP86_008447 [Pleurotus ostreatoroseus]